MTYLLNRKWRAGLLCLSVTMTLTAITLSAQATAPPAAALNAAEAQAALTTAVAAAGKVNANVACAVVDARGDLVALVRMDNARFFQPDIARGKALTSALFGLPSASVASVTSSPVFQTMNAAAQGRLYPIQGGVPIMRSNQVYGGIGCSGGSPAQDEEFAKAGAATF
jgi:uncharacterized protein GlcG (DUF336 family)